MGLWVGTWIWYYAPSTLITSPWGKANDHTAMALSRTLWPALYPPPLGLGQSHRASCSKGCTPQGHISVPNSNNTKWEEKHTNHKTQMCPQGLPWGISRVAGGSRQAGQARVEPHQGRQGARVVCPERPGLGVLMHGGSLPHGQGGRIGDSPRASASVGSWASCPPLL